MKDKYYNEDYIILPKYAFRSLSSWYPCNMIIERAVIKINSTTVDSFFKKRINNITYELEC
jgi:hypothetical protein